MGATDIEATQKSWERVAKYAVAARSGLNKTRKELTRRNLSPVVYNHLENANQLRYSSLTISALEQALGWPQGTVKNIIDDPKFLPPLATDSSDDLEARLIALEKIVDDVVSRQADREKRQAALETRLRLALDALGPDAQDD